MGAPGVNLNRPTAEEMSARFSDEFQRELKRGRDPKEAMVKAYVESEMMLRTVSAEERRWVSYSVKGLFEQPDFGSGLQEVDPARTRSALQDLLRDKVHPAPLLELKALPDEAFETPRELILKGDGHERTEVHLYRARGAVFVRQNKGPEWYRVYQVSPQWLKEQGLAKEAGAARSPSVPRPERGSSGRTNAVGAGKRRPSR